MWSNGVIEDFESSTGIFIQSDSEEEAISWAEKIGDKLFKKENPNETKDWKSFGHFCWIENDWNKSNWSHCLDFFQNVQVGQFPDFDNMGTKAYEKWVKNQERKEMIYLKFGDPKNAITPKTTGFKKVIADSFIKLISAIIPKANPDFEQLIEKVDIWKIEFNLKENYTEKEIGFDNNGGSIVAMPIGNNYGFWTDNNLTLDDYEHFNPIEISGDEFEKDWNEFEMKTGPSPDR
jgi:hypothetical protein